MKMSKLMSRVIMAPMIALYGIPRIQVFIVGTQRSGTTMLLNTLNRSLLCKAYGELDNLVMHETRLKERSEIEGVIKKEACPIQIFKPLNDSQHTQKLLKIYSGSRAIWVYRSWSDVVNSAIVKWGDWQKRIMLWIRDNYNSNEIYAKEPEKWFSIYKEGMTDNTADMLKKVVEDDISDEEGAALLWYTRNQLYFDQQMEDDPRVLVVKYEDMVTSPNIYIKRVFDFVECPFKFAYIRNIHKKSINRKSKPVLRDSVREVCESLKIRLDECHARQVGKT